MPTCWHFSRKVSKWPHRTNPAFTLMRRPGVYFDCLEAGRSKGTNRKLCDCWRNIGLCREEDSRVGGPGCRMSVGDRCWLRRNGLLFRQCDEQLVNLALLVWDREGKLCHTESLTLSQRIAQLAHQ
jgi:hypothetical protein